MSLALITLSLSMTQGCRKATPPPQPIVKSVPTTPRTEAPTPGPAVPDEVVEELERNFRRVYFGFDSSRLTGDAIALLERNATILQEHPGVRVQIQGHADERGTTEYNLALAMQRASEVRDVLTRMGASASRLEVVSFGEERPLAMGSRPSVHSTNRRVEFSVLADPDGLVDGSNDDPLPDEDELVVDGPEAP